MVLRQRRGDKYRIGARRSSRKNVGAASLQDKEPVAKQKSLAEQSASEARKRKGRKTGQVGSRSSFRTSTDKGEDIVATQPADERV